MRWTGQGWWAAGFVGLLSLGCQNRQALSPTPPAPPDAHPEILESLRGDLVAERHPGDGGGKAWIADGPAAIVAGTSGAWTIAYEAGPEGIQAGGWLFLQVSPFWGWSTPQTEDPAGPGFTVVATGSEGVELHAATLGQQLLGVEVAGRALAAGERIELRYGAGERGARADRYAERGSRFWIGVDADGDGVRGLVRDSPHVRVLAGRPAQLVLTVPSVARPGEPLRLHLAILDRDGNHGIPHSGTLELEPIPGLEMPTSVELRPADQGLAELSILASVEGVYRLRARAGELAGESNPLWVTSDPPPLLWGDLHGHSNLSDGTGTPDDYFRYARDVAALDIVALTDHDHWGMEPLALHPDLWEEIQATAQRYHQPGELVTLLGFEWTNWIYGHRHVLYFADQGPLLSSVDPRYETPQQLWAALRDQPALTFAHHSAGGPIATDWSIPPDPELEPVTEVVSVHGASEAADAPAAIYRPVAGNFVRDALERGYRLGFIGSGDSHDGHPGLARLAAPSGGLAAILSPERTREGVLAALRARRVYATNGPRIILQAALDGQPMGSALPPGEPGDSSTLQLLAIGTAPFRELTVVRSDETATVALDGDESLRLELPVEALRPGEFLYVRLLQEDGGAAWSSPFFGADATSAVE